MKSGLVAVVGRPNVGKSTLVNRLVGSKVSITSTRPQTTRSTIRGVVHGPDQEYQMVLLDTPGLHKPRAEIGHRLNRLVYGSLAEADVILFLLDANQPIGPGDRRLAERVVLAPAPVVVGVNKTDRARPGAVADQLAEASAWNLAAYVPISATTGAGLEHLLAELVSQLPEGPALFPPELVTDQAEEFLIGEIVREKFLDRLHEELPHSLLVRVTAIEEESELLRIEADVLVERDSQKGIVIGKGADLLKAAGSEARQELEAKFGIQVHLELRVRVEADWQRRPQLLDRLGFPPA
ncbi:MAG TPA: GTPase Era [Acidimicrobiia bacterium]|nr:GTPase Era [Acidimicrobiia bacterium]